MAVNGGILASCQILMSHPVTFHEKITDTLKGGIKYLIKCAESHSTLTQELQVPHFNWSALGSDHTHTSVSFLLFHYVGERPLDALRVSYLAIISIIIFRRRAQKDNLEHARCSRTGLMGDFPFHRGSSARCCLGHLTTSETLRGKLERYIWLSTCTLILFTYKGTEVQNSLEKI